MIVHPSGIQVLTVGDSPTKAVWTIPGIGHKVSSATFGIWPYKAKGDDYTIPVILVGMRTEYYACSSGMETSLM